MSKCARILALLTLVVSASCSRGYVVKFDRPENAGDQYKEDVSVDDTVTTEVSQQGLVINNDTIAIKVQAEVDRKNLSVDERGKPTGMTYTIRKWEGSLNGKPVTEVAEGMVIDAKVENDKSVITSKGRSFSPQVEMVLKRFLLSDQEAKAKTGMDAAFGASERKKVGDTWAINADATAKLLKEMEMVVDPKDISGSFTLQKVQQVGGIECMHLAGTIKVSKLQSADIGGVQAKVDSGGHESQMTFDLPVDTSLHLAAASLAGATKLDMEIPQSPVRLKASIVTKNSGTTTKLKP